MYVKLVLMIIIHVIIIVFLLAHNLITKHLCVLVSLIFHVLPSIGISSKIRSVINPLFDLKTDIFMIGNSYRTTLLGHLKNDH